MGPVGQESQGEFIWILGGGNASVGLPGVDFLRSCLSPLTLKQTVGRPEGSDLRKIGVKPRNQVRVQIPEL